MDPRSASATSFSVTMNALPLPYTLLTVMEPPIRFASPLQMASPSPVPPATVLLACANGSIMRSSSPDFIPMPESTTRIVSVPDE
ncbi:MAG: hypothetical protein E7049_04640 [Lentisphaerae bacterium]|nr:hypothetical protein [Lentisphaerota bacterium]